MRSTRTSSLSSPSIATSMSSASTPAAARSWRINASPAPRSASAAARRSAKRSSSTSPVRASVASASAPASRAIPRASRCLSICAALRSRWRSARRAASTACVSRVLHRRQLSTGTASSTSTSITCSDGCLRRKESCGDDLIVRCLGLDLREDLLDEVGVLREEARRILTALAEALVAEAEVRAGLLDDLLLERDVEHRPLPGNPGAVDDVELGLLERRRDLVLDDLDADAIAERLGAVLERLDPAGCRVARRSRTSARGRRASSPGFRT